MSIAFLLDEKPIVVPGGSAGEHSGGARKVTVMVVPLARTQSITARRIYSATDLFLTPTFLITNAEAIIKLQDGCRVGPAQPVDLIIEHTIKDIV